jgi:hypothetical protein
MTRSQNTGTAVPAGFGRGVAAARPWHDREKARALERLALARAHLVTMEQSAAPSIDPGVRAAVEERQRQIEALRPAASSSRRRARRAARQQLDALEGTQKMVTECLGFRTYEEFARAAVRDDSKPVDHAALDRARQDVARAERDFLEIAGLAVPAARPVARRVTRPVAVTAAAIKPQSAVRRVAS